MNRGKPAPCSCRSLCLADAVIGMQIDFLVLDDSPQALDKNIVSPRALAVHADRDAVVGQQRPTLAPVRCPGCCRGALPPSSMQTRDMKRTALYTRVSTDRQQQEQTIESQLLELKKQIARSGNVLVKEYIDDGYSGAELMRPGLRQLLEDAKSNSFKVIYFLGHERIARDVAHQILIVDELQKYSKQIIVSGKEDVNKPDDKLTLTVFGGVAEFERAKIMVRMRRGKLRRLRMGQLIPVVPLYFA